MKGPQGGKGLEHLAREERSSGQDAKNGKARGPHLSLALSMRRSWRIRSESLHHGAWWEDKTDGWKMKEERFSLDIRKKLFHHQFKLLIKFSSLSGHV